MNNWYTNSYTDLASNDANTDYDRLTEFSVQNS